MRYRIYIPALDPGGVSLTIDVEAANWMLALRYGLDEIGEDRDLVKRAVCDIKSDKTIRVMEPDEGRVFVLRELPSFDGPPMPPDRAQTVPLPSHHSAYSLADTELEVRSRPAPRRTISHLDLAGIRRANPRLVSRGPGRTNSPIRANTPVPDNDSLLTSLFHDLGELTTDQNSVEGALQFALELAMERIPSAAGWLLLSDINRRDLYVAMASGPKAEEVIRYRLPMGRGIAGFCAVNGVSLTLSDVERDPRFQMTLSRSVGLKIASVACAPVQFDGRVYGALQLMNHQQRAEYTPRELDALNFVSGRIAEYLVSYGVADPIR